jgi:hypothetical protein
MWGIFGSFFGAFFVAFRAPAAALVMGVGLA